MESFFATWLADMPYSRASGLLGMARKDVGNDTCEKTEGFINKVK